MLPFWSKATPRGWTKLPGTVVEVLHHFPAVAYPEPGPSAGGGAEGHRGAANIEPVEIDVAALRAGLGH